MGQSNSNWPSGPAYDGAAVTTSDSTDLTNSARALYIGATGDVKVKTWGGNVLTFVAVPIGFFPVSVTRVFATGTTATSIIALW